MKYLLRSLLILVIIALLLFSSIISTRLYVGRSNWQATIERAEEGDIEEQKLLARSYTTGGTFFESGFLVGRDLDKARHWRGVVCMSTNEEEYCRKL